MSIQIKYVVVLLSGLFLLGFDNDSFFNDNGVQIQIQWIDNLKGDFHFRTQWSYPEGIYRNKFGQLSCDGFCPDGIESMKDDDGKIHTDSLARFYQLVDTTHQFHTIQCKAWCYEWAGTDFIKAVKTENDHVICHTMTNSGTHCSLILEIVKDNCLPRIELNSVASPGIKTYYCKGGFIKMDKECWKQNIVKAEFNFDFMNTDEPDQTIFWEGKIYTKIDKK
jgi:hypothetical protein